jgi:hypothetical protein
VATFADVESVVLKTCVMTTVSPGSATEIATAKFREFLFCELRLLGPRTRDKMLQ